MRGSALKWLVVVAVIVVAIVAVPSIVPRLSDLNPFETETKDRSQPAVLRSLESLSEYRAATANYQQMIDIERDVGLLPSFLAGESAVLIAAGNVDAVVDFSGLGPQSVRVSEDRRAATVTLPAPQLSEPRVDLKRTRVVDTDRGLVDRVGDLFDDDANKERDLLVLAEQRIERAAHENSRLLRLAERNTRAMLTGMLSGLGFEQITVRFSPPPVRR
ncbi:MAG TPA: DUF4230 domain-containing protein [Solirubrobacteraceae bacterium]|nr:DUF4230 domain-containing protein [Solirubrobacteraceae bacterium]